MTECAGVVTFLSRDIHQNDSAEKQTNTKTESLRVWTGGGAQTRDQQDNLILGPQTPAGCEAVVNR